MNYPVFIFKPGFPNKKATKEETLGFQESKNFTASKNEGIKQAFLETLFLSFQDYQAGVVFWRGIEYTLESDLFLDTYFKEGHKLAKVVGSFQLYYPFAVGAKQAIVVCRLHRDLVPTTLKGKL